MTETYFHFTPEATWTHIQKEGLVPQPVKSWHQDAQEMCDQIGVARMGVYIWPEVNRGLLRDFFLFKQTHDRSVNAGLLLAVEVDPIHMLGRRWLAMINEKTGEENTLRQHHDLTFTLSDGSKRQDHNADMEIYLNVIPPENIERIARIYQVIEPVDNSPLAFDLGLTS